MSCKYSPCNQPIDFECSCGGTTQFFCTSHVSQHLQVLADHSSIKAIKGQESLKIVLGCLNKHRQEAGQLRQKLISDGGILMQSLQKALKEALKKLLIFDSEISRIIENLILNTEEIVDSDLKKTLLMPKEKAVSECAKWKFLDPSNNFSSLKSEISTWCKVNYDLTSLYMTSSDRPKANPSPSAPSTVSSRSSVQPPSQVILKCKNNHKLKWTYIVPFDYFKKFKNYWITCSFCEQTYSRPSWTCSDCNYDICEKCSSAIKIKSPKLVCTKGHELLWRTDVSMYYNAKGLGHNATCNNCKVKKYEAHWHCRECEFDICQTCGENAGFIGIKLVMNCPNGHPLVGLDNSRLNISGNIFCSQCKQTKNLLGKSYECLDCIYSLCVDCYEYSNSPIGAHPVLSCRSSHYLRWYKKRDFFCAYCLEMKNEELFACNLCNFTVCARCAYLLLSIIMNKIMKFDSKKHCLEWEAPDVAQNRICAHCMQDFKGANMFSCKNCQINYCLLCFDNPERNIQSIRNSINELHQSELLLNSVFMRLFNN